MVAFLHDDATRYDAVGCPTRKSNAFTSDQSSRLSPRVISVVGCGRGIIGIFNVALRA